MTYHSNDPTDIPEQCSHSDCSSPAGFRTNGLCYSHYQEYKEDEADYLYDMRRDLEYERRSNECR